MAGQEEQAVTKKNRRAAPLRFFYPMELDFLHHLWFDYIIPYISCQGRAFYQAASSYCRKAKHALPA